MKQFFIICLLTTLFLTSCGVKGKLSKPDDATYKRTYPKY